MAIGFFIGTEEIDFKGEYGVLPEKIIKYIYLYKEKIPFSVQPLLEIDPYGNTKLSSQEIKDLKNCLEKVQKENFSLAEIEAKELLDLIQFLANAYESHQSVIAVGD